MGFSLRWLPLWRSTGSRALRLQQLRHVGSVVGAPGLCSTCLVVEAHRLSCSVPCGIKPVSPAVAGRFFTTESTGKPISQVLYFLFPQELLANLAMCLSMYLHIYFYICTSISKFIISYFKILVILLTYYFIFPHSTKGT